MLPTAVRCKLYFWPYRTPRIKYGSIVQDEVRGPVQIVGMTDAAIPWPIGRMGLTRIENDRTLCRGTAEGQFGRAADRSALRGVRGAIFFPAAQNGMTENCPQCSAYVDVGDPVVIEGWDEEPLEDENADGV